MRRPFAPGLIAIAIACMNLVACDRVISDSTPVPPAGRASAPPLALQASLATRGAEFIPLTAEELEAVSVTSERAVEAALAVGLRQPIPLTRVGFVYLGPWSPPPQSLGHGSMPDPVSAYAIQLLAGPSAEEPDESALIVVHAGTGEPLIVLGACKGSNCDR
jgi:hypothetical protein